MDRAKAFDIHTVWKSQEQIDAGVALLKVALAQLDTGRGYFGPDEIDPAIDFGQHTMGIVIYRMQDAHIIRKYERTIPELKIKFGCRKSLRPQAKGRKLQLYVVTNRGIVEAWLSRHGVLVSPRQAELGLEA